MAFYQMNNLFSIYFSHFSKCTTGMGGRTKSTKIEIS